QTASACRQCRSPSPQRWRKRSASQPKRSRPPAAWTNGSRTALIRWVVSPDSGLSPMAFSAACSSIWLPKLSYPSGETIIPLLSVQEFCMDPTFRNAALAYHENGRPGKISVTPTKHLTNQRDLALAYSPGVAAACEEIVDDPANAVRYTARGNLVGVITNGTAVLGLGAIGALASKPVMEGKAVLFKKFAGIDVFDIEINETDPDKLVDIIAALEPTFGGI